MKKYIKSKSSEINPNASGPKYRTPDHFLGSQAAQGRNFSAKSQFSKPKFNPTTFKVQHKG